MEPCTGSCRHWAWEGQPQLEHLQKLDAHVHLDIVSQVTELQVFADVALTAKS